MRISNKIFLALLCLLPSIASQAHTIRPAVATVEIATNGDVSLAIRTNVEALIADIGPEHSDTSQSPNAPEYNRLRLLKPDALATAVTPFANQLLSQPLLTANGQPLNFKYLRLEAPSVGNPEIARNSTLYLTSSIEPDSTFLQWQWPEEYGSSVIRFNNAASAAVQSQWLQQGESSDPYPLSGDLADASPGIWNVISDYIVIGFAHIIPKGLDHILFVIGIFLLNVKLRPLLLQITAFTVAHTITLGLSIYGYIALSPSIVEPLIALSIAYVGIENCLSAKLNPWRIALVFGFGLLHGMGFAGVLSDIGLPRSEFLTALLSFNVGVELGQLTVIAACLLLLGWWRNKPWYRERIVIPLSLLIAATGLYWTWERIFG